ncbi:MAG: Sortase family enzyme [Candidatus Saccharibacteria bacterium]|nr:Sortase family enzyme [Candidatus Saccharibacteria bacterium]
MAGLEIKEKREFHLWRWFFVLLFVALLAVSGWYAYKWYTTGEMPPIPLPIASADPRVNESDVSQVSIDSYTVPATHPRYISIPKLGIEHIRVQKIGLNANNLIDMPKNIHDTGWYEKSAAPGQGYGAVLIDGHSGGADKTGAFTKLGTLQSGDKITIERGDGKKFTYSVVENNLMSLDEVNTTGMKQMMLPIDDDKEGLSLITTAGNWVPKIQQFDQRVMLRATISDQ